MHRRFQNTNTCRGTSLVETVVAMVVLGVAIALVVTLLTTVARQRRSVQQRLFAAETVANIVSEVQLLPEASWTKEKLATISLPESAKRRLPAAKLTISVNTESDPEAKRATVALTWQDAAHVYVKPVRLTVWRYP